MSESPEQVVLGGLEVTVWVDMFENCHNIVGKNVTRISWPDGKCYFDQENLTVEMFSLLKGVADTLLAKD